MAEPRSRQKACYRDLYDMWYRLLCCSLATQQLLGITKLKSLKSNVPLLAFTPLSYPNMWCRTMQEELQRKHLWRISLVIGRPHAIVSHEFSLGSIVHPQHQFPQFPLQVFFLHTKAEALALICIPVSRKALEAMWRLQAHILAGCKLALSFPLTTRSVRI